MRTGLLITIVSVVLVTAACSSTFVISKQGEVYSMGSDSNARYEALCASGEMDKVLAASELSKEIKDSINKSICSEERSSEKFKQLYASMTGEQKKDLKSAFRSNGYSINPGKGCSSK
jgi:hypothetical protein